MARDGELSVEVEVKSMADKFWNTMRNSTIIFPKVFPQYYKSIEVLEGDGKAVGSIRLLTYSHGSDSLVVKERIESVDEEKKMVSYRMLEGDLLMHYKNFKGQISVSPKEDGSGSLVKWKCEYEKASELVADPHAIGGFVVKNLIELDSYICNMNIE